MDVKEKLVELLRNSPYLDTVKGYKGNDCTFEQGADWLIAHGVTVQEWIPVTERLPEENVNCIVHYRHAYCDNDGYFAIGFCCHDGEKFQFDPAYKVTHWMPLPLPPKGEEGNHETL